MVVNEALDSDLYVLCSKYAGVAYDLIEKGQNGEVFDPNNVEDLVGLINRIKERISDIRKRRDDISQYSCNEFSIERPAQEFIKAINSLKNI